MFYLTFPEVEDAVRTHRVDERLIREAQGSVHGIPGAHAAASADVGRGGRSPGHTEVRIGPPVRSQGWRYPPGLWKAGLAWFSI